MPDPAFADGAALDHGVVSRIQHRFSGSGPIFSQEKIRRLKVEGEVEYKPPLCKLLHNGAILQIVANRYSLRHDVKKRLKPVI